MPCSAWCGTAEICLVEKQIVIHGSSSGPLGRIMPRSSPHAPLSPAAAASGARGSRRCWRAPPQWLEVVAIVSAVSAPSEPGQTQARLYLEAPDQATLPYVLRKSRVDLTSASIQQVRSILVADAGA